MPRNCVNSQDNFCSIFGEVNFSTRKRPLTLMAKKAYECYFGWKFGDQDKKRAPNVCCISCATILREWLNNHGHSVTFALPMIWRVPTDYLTDCYFCIVPPLRHGIAKKNKTVSYPNISSAIRPVTHPEELPVLVPLQPYILDSDEEPTENREKTPQPSISLLNKFFSNE